MASFPSTSLLNNSCYLLILLSYNLLFSFTSFLRAYIYLVGTMGKVLVWHFPIWWNNYIWKFVFHLYLYLFSCHPSSFSFFFFFPLLSTFQSHTGLFLNGSQATWEEHLSENQAGGRPVGRPRSGALCHALTPLSMLPSLPRNTAIQPLVWFLKGKDKIRKLYKEALCVLGNDLPCLSWLWSRAANLSSLVPSPSCQASSLPRWVICSVRPSPFLLAAPNVDQI